MKYPVPAQMQRLPVSMMAICRSLGLAILLIAFHSLAFSRTPQSPIEPITAALRSKDFDKAVELTRAALKESPNNVQLWTLQGIALASKGDGKGALAAFQRGLIISPDNIGALAGASQILYQEGKQEAVPMLNHLLQLRPDDPTAHAMLAVLNYKQGNCAGAVPHFEKVGELLDSQVDAL